MYLFCKLIISVIIIINKGIRDTVVLILCVLYIADIIIAIVGKRLLSAEGIPHGGHIGNYAVCIAAVCLIGIRYSTDVRSAVYSEPYTTEICIRQCSGYLALTVVILRDRAEPSRFVIIAIIASI